MLCQLLQNLLFIAFVHKFFPFQRCEGKSKIGHLIYDFRDPTFTSDTVAVCEVLKFCSLRVGRRVCIIYFR
jgi:hypothetical protein